MPQGQAFQAPAASPLQLNTGLPQKQGLFSGFAPKPQPPAGKSPFNVSGGDVFRMFFGGSPQGASPSSNAQAQKNAQNAQNQQKLYSAREYLQTANDQAQRARDAYASSMSGDKWSRTNNADTAYYAAQAARGAADSATAAAAGGTSDAQDAAAQARNAADEAQANADRARANADSYNPSSNSGW